MGSRSGPLAGTAPELHQVLPPSLSDLPARVFHEMVLLGHHEHWTQPGHPPPSSPLLTQAPWSSSLAGPRPSRFTARCLCLASLRPKGPYCLVSPLVRSKASMGKDFEKEANRRAPRIWTATPGCFSLAALRLVQTWPLRSPLQHDPHMPRLDPCARQLHQQSPARHPSRHRFRWLPTNRHVTPRAPSQG